MRAMIFRVRRNSSEQANKLSLSLFLSFSLSLSLSLSASLCPSLSLSLHAGGRQAHPATRWEPKDDHGAAVAGLHGAPGTEHKVGGFYPINRAKPLLVGVFNLQDKEEEVHHT